MHAQFRHATWIGALLLGGCITTHAVPPAERPAVWAQPVATPHLPNLHRVSAVLWRSALPDREGFAAADRLGIRTIVNLRPSLDVPASRTNATLEHIPVWTWHVTDAEILAFLRIATDPTRQPVLVHCQHGADRTGVMVAAYRVVVQGWSKDDAIREMQRGGYNYHAAWVNLPGVIRRMDVERTRRALGLPVNPAAF